MGAQNDDTTVDRKVARKIIQQAVKDLAHRDQKVSKKAKQYVMSRTFTMHRELAGYPVELRDSLLEMMLVSKAARRYMRRETLRLLRDEWDTNTE